jgi:hypothetical protein
MLDYILCGQIAVSGLHCFVAFKDIEEFASFIAENEGKTVIL